MQCNASQNLRYLDSDPLAQHLPSSEIVDRRGRWVVQSAKFISVPFSVLAFLSPSISECHGSSVKSASRFALTAVVSCFGGYQGVFPSRTCFSYRSNTFSISA